MATGANSSRHGIVANDWIDAATGAFVYNTEDDRHHILGAEKKPHQGVSPRNLLSTTIGDELVLHRGGKSRAFSVSPKDRGAILPGGHLGKAFWYSKSRGQFVTSSFCYESYPDWAKSWNDADPLARYRGRAWELLNDPETYLALVIDEISWALDAKVSAETFAFTAPDGAEISPQEASERAEKAQ